MSKPPAAEPGMEPEPENDFVPASYTYDSQMEIISSLDAAVMYWRTAAHDVSDSGDILPDNQSPYLRENTFLS